TPLQALDGVANACDIGPAIFGGGQPSLDHLRRLKEAGIGIVLDLRDPMEPRPFDEPALVRELGMEYVNVPVTASTLTDATLDRIIATLRGADARPVFCHCAGGNRVGGAVLAYLMTEKGLSEDDATAQAMRAGLRSADMLEWGLDYARRKANASA